MHMFMACFYGGHAQVTRQGELLAQTGQTSTLAVYMESSYSTFAARLPHNAEMALTHRKDLSRLKR